MYHADAPFPVYCQKCWWGDGWDAIKYGREYDFNRSFFEQFRDLQRVVPAIALVNNPAQNVRSEYSNYVLQNKDCYLLFGSHYNENCAYCWYGVRDKECLDVLEVTESELVYEGNFVGASYNCAFVEYVFDSRDCFFSYDLRGCNNCFLSYNLRSKNYCILNEEYSKEEYFKKIAEFNIGSFASLGLLKKKFSELKKQALRRSSYQKNSVGCIGDDMRESKNIRHGFRVELSEDCAYCYPKITAAYNSMDISKIGYDRSEFCYEVISCTALNNSKFGQAFWQSHDLEYGHYNFSCGNLFGCISMKHKEYCILNRQYSKAEYFTLLSKITEQMKSFPYIDKKGRVYHYGEFFPIELSPFGYNESTAPDAYPLSKDEAVANGYPWRDPDVREFQKQTYSIPDNIKDVKDDILEVVLSCGECKKNYRIANMELQFYRRVKLPIPRLCFKCRHFQRMNHRNPLKLWHRQCVCDYTVRKNSTKHPHHPEGRCANEFETSYASERPEVVYCETCYQAEVV